MLGGLFGESWDDPRTALTMGLAQGLLGARGIGGATFGDALAAGIGQGIPAYQQARQLQTRERLGNEEMRLRGEDSAMRRQEFESRIAEAKRKQAEQEAVKAQLAAWVQTLPPEMQQLAAIAPEKVIDQFFKKDAAPLVTKPGDILRDPNNPQRVLAENPAPPEKDPEFVRMMRLEGVQEGTPEWRSRLFNWSLKQSTHQPGTSVSVNTGQRGFDNTAGLRKEYDALPETKAFKEVATASEIIRGALKTPTPANDLAAATKFMKLLDPNSVVRESELAMAMAATGLLDRAHGYADMVIKGTKLNPQQRKDFYEATNRIMQAAEAQQRRVAQRYRVEAEKWGLDPNSVTPGLGEPKRLRFNPATGQLE